MTKADVARAFRIPLHLIDPEAPVPLRYRLLNRVRKLVKGVSWRNR